MAGKLFLAVAGAAVLFAASATFAAPPEPDPLDYTVLRKGKQVGSHRVSFAYSGDDLQVGIETDVKVKIFGLTVYKFEHQGDEVWRDGRLIGLTSRTDDDGSDKQLRVRINGEHLQVNGSATTDPAPLDIIPASLWNRVLVEQAVLLNTLDGSQMSVRVAKMGEEQIPVRGVPVSATHYSVTGELARELWYSEQGVLVKVAFKGEDGSQIEYVLR